MSPQSCNNSTATNTNVGTTYQEAVFVTQIIEQVRDRLYLLIMGYHIPQALLSPVTLFPSTGIAKVTSKSNCSRSTTNFSYKCIVVFYLGQFAFRDIKLGSDAMHKCAEGLIMTILTGRGPRSPGSIEFLLLIWTGYFNLGSSWLSKEGT